MNVLNNVKIKTMDYIENNLKEVCENEPISVDEVFYFIVFLF